MYRRRAGDLSKRYLPFAFVANRWLRTEVSGDLGRGGLAPVYCCYRRQPPQYSASVQNYCSRAAWEYTGMKKTAHISVVIALGLVSLAALSGLHAAQVQGDKKA